MLAGHRVHIPTPFGKVISAIAPMREDFPALLRSHKSQRALEYETILLKHVPDLLQGLAQEVQCLALSNRAVAIPQWH